MPAPPAPSKGVTRAPVNNVAQAIARIRARRVAPTPAPKPAAHAPAAHAPAHAKAKAAPLPDPTQLLTPKQINQEANAATSLKFGPQEQAIQGQQRASNQEQRNIGDWFSQYKADVAASQQASAAYDAGAQAAMSAQAQQAQAQAQQDPTQSGSAEAQQAAAARRSTSDSYGAMLAAQGSAHNTFFADKGRIAGGEEADQHVKEAGRAQTLKQQLGDLKGQAGEYKTGQVASERAAERQYLLEGKAFDLNVQSEQDKAAAAKAAAKASAKAATTVKMEKDRNYRLNKQKFGAAQAKDTYQRTHALGPYKVPTVNTTAGAKHASAITGATGKVQTKVQDITDALGAGGTVQDTSKPPNPITRQYPTRPATPKEVAAAVGQKYSPMWVRIAKDVQSGKPLNSAEIAYLHSQDPNVRIPKPWLAGKNQAPRVTTAPSGVPGQSRPT